MSDTKLKAMGALLRLQSVGPGWAYASDVEAIVRYVKQFESALPHPDTARRDKLPALRDLVDRVWNEATESEQVPSTEWADRIIKQWVDAHQEPKP